MRLRLPLSLCFTVFAILFAADAALAQPCAPTSYSNNTPVNIVDNATRTSTIVVAGAPAVLTDLNLITTITHTWCSDLDITLTSPAGTVVTITTDNGGSFANVFNGTTWDDNAGTTNAPGSASDNTYAGGAVETPLCPEEPLGAFIGENPNGTWTLSIADDATGDVGILNSWSLVILGRPNAYNFAVSNHPNATPLSIVDNTTVTRQITVSGAGTQILDVNLISYIRHTYAADLDITLTSPSGTVVTISTDNGGSNDNVFNGTIWDDKAGATNAPGAITDITFANNVVETPLAPEEPLAAFIGENPNGTWILSIADDAGGDTGTLDSVRLTIQTLVDNQAPVINTQPLSRSVCAQENVTFTVAATNGTGYQWQVSVAGGAYVDIPGATGTTLTLNNLLVSMNGNRYRVLVYGPCTQIISNVAILTVNRLPTISLSADPAAKIHPGQLTGLLATFSGMPGTFSWYRNNVLVRTTIGPRITGLDIDSLGLYRVMLTDTGGCKASGEIRLEADPNFQFFVYPTPNNGQFQVRFYSYTLGVKRTLTVFDSKGGRAFRREFVMNNPYEKMDVDVSRYTPGVYHVELRDANGKVLGSASTIYIK